MMFRQDCPTDPTIGPPTSASFGASLAGPGNYEAGCLSESLIGSPGFMLVDNLGFRTLGPTSPPVFGYRRLFQRAGRTWVYGFSP